MTSISLSIEGEYHAPLSKSIQKEYNKLINLVVKIPEKDRYALIIDGTGGIKINVDDVIANQIGWGNLLLGWYEAGLQDRLPEMPGEGFTTWDYPALAQLFYKKYQYKDSNEQAKHFFRIVKQIIDIVEKEHNTKNLDKEGVWRWCQLSSGREWPLSKWITVNTVTPYKSAALAIKKAFKNK
jgi:hypothetical protein